MREKKKKKNNFSVNHCASYVFYPKVYLRFAHVLVKIHYFSAYFAQ